MNLRTLQFFLCQLGEIHHQEVRQDLYKLLFEQNLETQDLEFFSLKMTLPPIKRTYCPLRSILAFVLVKTFPATE